MQYNTLQQTAVKVGKPPKLILLGTRCGPCNGKAYQKRPGHESPMETAQSKDDTLQYSCLVLLKTFRNCYWCSTPGWRHIRVPRQLSGYEEDFGSRCFCLFISSRVIVVYSDSSGFIA